MALATPRVLPDRGFDLEGFLSVTLPRRLSPEQFDHFWDRSGWSIDLGDKRFEAFGAHFDHSLFHCLTLHQNQILLQGSHFSR
jgi:hypothetical protein